ncbi:hypothetical protein SCE1572_27980 [Sorangium cellulosum So0157-2]|uniref:Uncharacterized protein n=1 Tax=Sorangium cellulosum So0157-2 TaxID=1254432 RepID=S4Y1E0_SORCE|nr:hypothetical protein SCE1572_27980 [Sorangium cellulosum So0157-2]
MASSRDMSLLALDRVATSVPLAAPRAVALGAAPEEPGTQTMRLAAHPMRGR